MDTLSMHAGSRCRRRSPATAGDRWFGGRFTGPGRGITSDHRARDARRGHGSGAACRDPGLRQEFGGVCAELMSAEGMTVVAVSDSNLWSYHADGIDLTLAPLKEEGGISPITAVRSNRPYSCCRSTSTCSSRRPEAQISERNADRVRARASPRCERAADHRGRRDAEARGVSSPDILAMPAASSSRLRVGAGHPGVLLGSGEVNSRLREVMTRSYQQVRSEAQSHDITLRNAAFALAVTKVAEATKVRGIYPYRPPMWWVPATGPQDGATQGRTPLAL